MTLVEFLRARLDEDEHDGRRLASIRGGVPIFIEGDGEPIVIAGVQLLAEVEAKRRIVELCEAGVEPHAPATPGVRAGYRAILRYLAAPYADHPAYDPSWRP